ncbi:dipeptidyl peptidase IV N-terminal region-domain-containing protein [Stachybotrys elegans]|uniref:Probable dipeptidyl-aminopeptidase B n=1 Tax=Stachybotrys elegans TaxID=80388 RepID=A0A8K0T1R4_9HYPO|nr:dipeptidyl peptidase IV N-terminal region-domain-containing protein [Stachybotrys elegans]
MAPSPYKDRSLDDEDPLKDEESNDLETGPFLDHPSPPAQRLSMDKGMRRGLIVVASLFLLGWLAALGVFLTSRTDTPVAQLEDTSDEGAHGSGKHITIDQLFDGSWYPAYHSISWIASPDGQDGLLLEQGAQGKDYLVVEDVRVNKGQPDANDDPNTFAASRTLMKDQYFSHSGRRMKPDWASPSPNLKKVLIGVDRVKNWRHSFTATYFILNVDSQTIEPLDPSDDQARVQLASWSPQSDAIAFTRDNNLFIRRLDETGDIVQITKDGGPEYFYGVPDWVYEEEVFSGRSATWWSDDGKYIAFLRTNETGVPEFPVPFFIEKPASEHAAEGEDTYPYVQQIKYPRAGSHNPVVDLQFYDVDEDEVFSVTTEDQFPDDDRIINYLVWAGDKVILKETNRVSDILKVILVDVPERQGKTINTIDVGKIDGGWFEISRKMTFVPADADNGRPEDGYVDVVIHDDYEHLAYFTPLDNPEPKMLTSGKWEVDNAPAAVDLVNNLVYFTATKESSIQRHVYSVKLDGNHLTPLTNTSSEAYFSASFSSGAGFVFLSYAGPRIPYQKVMSTPSSKIQYDHVIEDNHYLAEKARKYELPILKYGELELDNGVTVNYLERRPPHFNPKKKYPVLFQQYSGPGSQMVAKRFKIDFQSYVASALGYLVVTVDPRGTGFRGRKHRVGVRSQLGVLEAEDHIASARHYASLDYVDEDRLAIWGWSYGGFTTLKTLEQDAGRTFSYGMAVAPVTDWRFYDSIYTERYMRTPQANLDGYLESAVMNATALGQNKRFLIMHGVSDDNVHFQNTLALLDELDLHSVENYDVHVFPDSDHSIYFHNGNRIVYDKLNNWLINAFNGEWLKVTHAQPNGHRKRQAIDS